MRLGETAAEQVTLFMREKGVTYDPSTRQVIDCRFCNIVARKLDSKIVYEDEMCVAFESISPATSLHLLISPRDHIKNTDSLSGEKGAETVKMLVKIGKLVLGDLAEDAQFCFHLAPFNSIDHLHLHAIAYPQTMCTRVYRKYNQNMYYCQSAESLIRQLERKHRQNVQRVSQNHYSDTENACLPQLSELEFTLTVNGDSGKKCKM